MGAAKTKMQMGCFGNVRPGILFRVPSKTAKEHKTEKWRGNGREKGEIE